MNRIALIGPGAIGGTMAAWLAQSPDHDVTVCARTPLDSLEVDTPYGVIKARLRCVTRVDEATAVDWVLIATKTYDVVATAAWLPMLIAPHTTVAVLQNGVEHIERFAPWIASERILPVIIECPAERLAPGRIRQRRAAWMAVPDTSAGAEFKNLFRHSPIEVRLTADFLSTAWRKLCLNCASSVSALLLKPSGIVHRDDIAELMRGLIRECMAVARAEGAVLEDELPDIIINAARSGARDSINSMHADRLAGRQMEIDTRNGVIVRRGAVHGIAAPLHQLMVTLLSAAQ